MGVTGVVATYRPTFDSDQARSLACALLIETRDEITRADNKASILLGLTAVIGSVLVAGMMAGDWTPSGLEVWPKVLWWCGVGAGACAVLFASLCVYPRFIQPNHDGAPRYFGDIAQLDDEHALRVSLNRGPEQDDKRIVNQLLIASRIVVRKYRLLRFSLASLGVAIVMTVASVLA